MGQKMNPLGFRVNISQNHYSIWFAQPKDYSKGLQEDKKIRNYIMNYAQKRMKELAKEFKFRLDYSPKGIGIARIEIKKNQENPIIRKEKGIINIRKKMSMLKIMKIKIYTGFPIPLIKTIQKRRKKSIKEKIKELKMNLHEELKMNLQKEFNWVPPKQLYIDIIRIKKPYGHSTILAEFIAQHLKKRISLRKIISQAIKLSNEANTKGLKIQIAGRIQGKEKARIKWIQTGRVPLQTIRAKMDYCAYSVRTIYGILGIKIWIFLGEK
uniref:ribosomal protein S3 n=1 Tax=Drosera capensis TaxID=4366 RepID=UPI002410B866|nr:ribosomal protein S3 [Drosera capensis]WEQ03464.1 ribosomal protein S3 [Drosera capensis]